MWSWSSSVSRSIHKNNSYLHSTAQRQANAKGLQGAESHWATESERAKVWESFAASTSSFLCRSAVVDAKWMPSALSTPVAPCGTQGVFTDETADWALPLPPPLLPRPRRAGNTFVRRTGNCFVSTVSAARPAGPSVFQLFSWHSIAAPHARVSATVTSRPQWISVALCLALCLCFASLCRA